MAKVKGPLMSMEARGAFGGTLVFAGWKGTPYVRQLVTPSNPQTTGQQNSRAGLGAAGRVNNMIQTGSDAQTKLNAAAPSGQSGASYFAGRMAKNFAQSKTDYATVGNATVKGYFDTAAASLGLTTLTIPGASPLTVSPGLQLWNAYATMRQVDETLATTVVTSATAPSIATLVDAFSA